MTAAPGFIVSFGVVFFLAMLQPSSSSTSLFSVVPVAILGAEGGSGVLVLSLVFTRRVTSISSSESWVSSSVGWYVSELLVWSVSSAASNALVRRQGRQSLYPLKILAHWGWMAS